MPRPHPAHTRRRGLLSQVQILGLAPSLMTSWIYLRKVRLVTLSSILWLFFTSTQMLVQMLIGTYVEARKSANFHIWSA